MKITIFAAGSQGDIQPCVALGKGLQRAGYQVCLAVPENFADYIHKNNLDFYALRGDVQQIMSSDFGKDFMETGGSNPIKSIGAIRKMMAPIVMEMTRDAFGACRSADALICLGVFSPFGQSIAEALNIPLINIEPTPLLPSRSFPAPSWPIQRDLGGAHNYLSGILMLMAIWMWYSPFVKEFRQNLGLPAKNAAYFYRALKTNPLLGAYSPRIIPHPTDWPDNVHITGSFFVDNPDDWQPSAELSAFLDAGAPPVYIGFGSMAGSKAEELSELVFQALEMCGQRGLILTGWGGLQSKKVPDNVFILESAPHNWLFPRMAAVVHHGGAGTTAEGLRAGVPTVVVPFLFDQFFWGARVKAQRLGPDPIPRKNLTAERLADAIKLAVTDPVIREKAAACGTAIREEDGVENAVKVVIQILGDPTLVKKGLSK